MSTLITGATGYLGSYVVHELLARDAGRLTLLVRGRDRDEAVGKLWRSLQLHLDGEAFHDALDRCDIVLGDLHAPELGLDEVGFRRLAQGVDSVLHMAASLNRKSSRACFNTNLRGTLSVLRLAAAAGVKRFSQVSTVAVAGHRQREIVHEDDAIDWNRSDYDPYARTKKFAEHLAAELLPDVTRTVFRPSIVLGDARFAETTQFDMVRAVCALADAPFVPLAPAARLDVVNADFVGEAIARLHLAPRPAHACYHLSAGATACTGADIGEALARVGRPLRFAPRLERPAGWAFRALNRLPRGSVLQQTGAMMKVFWPYVTYDTVFDNTRVCTELGIAPTPFPAYCGALYRYARGVRFRYPYRPLPPRGVVRRAG